jgi:hypothetical protein
LLEVTVTGQEEMRRTAARMRSADATFDRNLVNGIRRAVAPLGSAIKAGVPTYMPSGYAPVLGPALSTTTSVRQVRGPGVSVRVSAKGRTRKRDVRSLDLGILAHKLFGHPPWFRQRIRAGFVTDKFRAMRGPIVAETRRVIEDILERITRG